MDFEELNKKVQELKAQGLSEDDILTIFFEAFKREEMNLEDLEKAAGVLGYDLNDDFKKEFSGEKVDGLTQSEIEDAKEIKPGESKEEFKEKVEDMADDDVDVNGPKSDEEKEKAMKQFGLR